MAAMPDFGSDKMPERDLSALAGSGEFDPRGAMLFTYGQMGHSVAWVFRRSDTRLLFAPGEMEYGAVAARRDGVPLLWTHGGGGEFARLVRDPKRRVEVVYIAPVDEVERLRGKWLLKLGPRCVVRGCMMAMIFDPVTSPSARPASPAAASPAPPAR